MNRHDCAWCWYAKMCPPDAKYLHFIRGYCEWFKEYEDFNLILDRISNNSRKEE